MNTKGLSEPLMAISRGFSKRSVIWLCTVSPRMVPMRNTTCFNSGCSVRQRASISSTSRLWYA